VKGDNKSQETRDRYLHLRTDDIEGASAKKWWLKPARGKKVQGFFNDFVPTAALL